MVISAHTCSLNQVAYRGCNDFQVALCAIENVCTADVLKRVMPSCSAPPEELCATLSSLRGLLAGAGSLALVFNFLMSCAALLVAQRRTASKEPASSASAVQPSPSLDASIEACRAHNHLESQVQELQADMARIMAALERKEESRLRKRRRRASSSLAEAQPLEDKEREVEDGRANSKELNMLRQSSSGQLSTTSRISVQDADL